MFNIDEKSIADNRTLVTIQSDKNKINSLTKNGTINYSMDGDNVWLTTPKIRQAYISKDININNYYDKFVLARNGVNIDGEYTFDNNTIFSSDVEIKNNLIIKGNMTVSGTFETVNSPSLSIEDNVIELNRNEVAAGITLDISGTSINRGTNNFARYLYSESNKAFVLDTGLTSDDAVSDSWVMMAYTEDNGTNIAGELKIANKLTVPIGSLTDLVVSGSTSLNTLTASGISTFTGTSSFLDTLTIYGQLTSKVSTLLEGALTVNKTSLFNDNVTMAKTLVVDGISTFNGQSTFSNGLTVSAVGANITGQLNVTGDTLLTGAITTTENASFSKDIIVTQSATVNKLTATTKLTTLDAQVNQNLVVTGSSTFNDNLTVNATKTTLNSDTEITGNVTITSKDLILTCAEDGSGGDITVNGNALINKTLTVDSTSLLKGNVTTNGSLLAENIISKSNMTVEAVNGNGYEFHSNPLNKIYMSESNDVTYGGSVPGSATSDYNLYYKIADGTNRGHVFKNGSTSIMQIESTGTLRALGNIFADGSQVLRHADMGHNPENNTAINACMLDGKHVTDLFLSDGSQAFTGDIQLDTHSIKFSDNDYFRFSDTALDLTSGSYLGTYEFLADDTLNKSVLSAGAIKIDNTHLESLQLSGVDTLLSSTGKAIFTSTETELTIGGSGETAFTDISFSGPTTVKIENTLSVANKLIANSTSLTYNEYDILTTAGTSNMLGDINMKASRLLFNCNSDTETDGAALNDTASIYAEHNADTEINRLVISMLDNVDDSIVFKTGNTVAKDSLIINNSKSLFSDNPYCIISSVEQRLLHTGDTGSGNNLNADKLDGKHYTDLQTEFVTCSGDTMTGELLMKNNLNMYSSNKIIFNELADSYIKAGGTSDNDILFGATNQFSFTPGSDITKIMLLKADGNLSVLGSNVLRIADIGHGKGIDADTIDSLHLTDLDSRYINSTGGTLSGDLTIEKVSPTIILKETSATSSNAIIKYKANGGKDVELKFTEYDTDLPEDSYGIVIKKSSTNIEQSKKACLSVEGNIYANGLRVLTENNIGSGSSTDADTLDGQHGDYYSPATHLHDDTYAKKSEVDLQSKYKIQYNSSDNSLDFLYVG